MMIGLTNINMAIYLVSTLKERLQKAMEGPPKVTQAALSKATGLRPASVNGWLTGSTKNIAKHCLTENNKKTHPNPPQSGFFIA